MLELKVYANVTDQGPYLQLNEDLIDVDLVNSLYMIFDGFGGANVGDKAARLVSETIKKFYTKFGVDPDITMPFFYSPNFLLEGNAIINAVKIAHEKLKEENSKIDMNNRGGASGVIVSESDNVLNILSVGNCTTLLFSKGEVREIFLPLNFELLSQNSYDRSFQTFPTTAFGLFSDLYYEMREVKVEQGDTVVILTDGAYGRLNLSEIKHILNQGKKSYKERIQEIFSLNNSRGNMDNQSVLILEY